MTIWSEVPFKELILDSKDGEWGAGEHKLGWSEAVVIRGTDFAVLDQPDAEFPRRWVKDSVIRRKRLQPGDILLETAGGTSTQSTGRTALIKNSFFVKHAELPALCASFSRHLRLNTRKYSPRFIYYLLQVLYQNGYMAVYNIQHTGVSRFQYTTFKNHTKLDIPELKIQRNIAAILSAYDELIDINRRRIVLLEKAGEEVYREWFLRFRCPGSEGVKLLNGVPEGWNVKRFSEIVENHIGGGWGEENQSVTFSEGAYVIRGTDIPDMKAGEFENRPFRFHKPSNLRSRTLAANDFVFETSGGSKDQLLGRNLFVTQAILDFFTGPAIPASFCKKIRFRSELVSPYFMRFFMELYYRSDLVSIYQTQSTGISNFHFETFLKFQTIILPPTELQRRFEEAVRPMIAMRDQIAVSNILLRRSRDVLLARLMSGRLSVDNLDLRLPPGVLEEIEADQQYGAHA